MKISGIAEVQTVFEQRTKRFFLFGSLAVIVLLAALLTTTAISRASAAVANGTQDAQATKAYESDPAALLAAYRHVEVASVSDAIEQLLGKRMYLSHRFQPIYPTHFSGYALTVRLEKQENHDAHSTDGMLEAIDHGAKDSVEFRAFESLEPQIHILKTLNPLIDDKMPFVPA